MAILLVVGLDRGRMRMDVQSQIAVLFQPFDIPQKAAAHLANGLF